ncbi:MULTISPECIES: Rrf2 family transcriptional regulator [Chryseobacterium]|jgi:Predicted transcriptional regulator|uniref:Rrf2 family transcriptional regulator n=1 Tax=Chryseobacterium rhizosphaerae TaxID=395937 RepID=A0ABX9IGF4_9FLAO|nr:MULTISPECIES: Rrf2 family transcriptional regulator [Chryseobacterium]MDC8101581.1 Rrf2 family transcriptional regulator [Chryseobacterium rhizosphaerae]MDR6544214.1 Rrf2 family protein [Chryseobacterium rhizosphaerae]REC71999.1 Rrf2 family transcriptional regulator [Chryseobacterium rhizosphaerae]SMC86347.1 Rrf2 family protein [Chryseobacterium sp. YR221]GEN69101.1 Rrf2 family transcriptional regulator [Chryseobacterium rhizosphaerae]
MNNTRFATAVHIMTLLAKSPQEWLTSEWIAGSINVNPVIVRKEMSVLREAGLIASRQGKEGGSQLAKNEELITISEIYKAVKNTEVLGKKNQNPNPACSVGKEINVHLNTLFEETDQLVVNFLGDKSLREFADQFE